MRIEIGRGLEGNITDGTAGAILDSYLVPAKQSYDETGNSDVFDSAFLDTVVALAEKAGYVSDNNGYSPSLPAQSETRDDYVDPSTVILFVIFFGVFIAMAVIRSRGGGRGGGFYGGGWGGGWGWGWPVAAGVATGVAVAAGGPWGWGNSCTYWNGFQWVNTCYGSYGWAW